MLIDQIEVLIKKHTLKGYMEGLERELIKALLLKHGGLKTKVAEVCALSRQGLLKKLEKHRLAASESQRLLG